MEREAREFSRRDREKRFDDLDVSVCTICYTRYETVLSPYIVHTVLYDIIIIYYYYYYYQRYDEIIRLKLLLLILLLYISARE